MSRVEINGFNDIEITKPQTIRKAKCLLLSKILNKIKDGGPTMLSGFFLSEKRKRNKVKGTVINYLIFSFIIFLSVLMSSCNSPMRPPEKDNVIA